MLSDQDRLFIAKHRAAIISAVVFAALGILFMALGFLKTMFVVLLGVAGWAVGRVAGDRELIRRFLNNYLGK
ncbi:MAG: DUF2273 domain-containing protein [bacterium]